MSGRVQALMRTRCPDCGTIFRVTSEQLRLKAGKVRCGQCQCIFNAFDEFLPDGVAPPERELAEIELPSSPDTQALPDRDEEPGGSSTSLVFPSITGLPDEPAPLPLAAFQEEDLPEPETQVEPKPEVEPEVEAELEPEPEPEPEPEQEALAVAKSESATIGQVPEIPVESPLETPDETTQAAREAGLVAARELSDTPGYNRWAAGTLASDELAGFGSEPVRHAVWPFVLVAIALFLALSGQLLYHFRSAVVQHLPAAAQWFELAAVDVPLPQNVDLVAIDTSDLQSDNGRGLFVLNATLHNRANYAQAWPALELTLTDTSDTVVSRRVMGAADYLPPAISPEAFPANGEVAVRLWIEARDIGAAGYRLYVFYP